MANFNRNFDNRKIKRKRRRREATRVIDKLLTNAGVTPTTASPELSRQMRVVRRNLRVND